MELPADRVITLLSRGEMELLGLMPNASNHTFAARVSHDGIEALAVYKPQAGETPLWDFPEGTLYAREMAAFEVARALGWEVVPPTVVRDGPYGIGAVQLFIDAEPGEHYLTLMPERAEVFRRTAALDVVINNADRKSGHCLLERGTGRIWLVDHGVCFHPEPKLRTVIWDFAGEPLPDEVRPALDGLLDRLAGGRLCRRLQALLEPEELAGTRARAQVLLASGRFPSPPEGRRSYPWPPI